MKLAVDLNTSIVIIETVNWVDVYVVENMMECIEILLFIGPWTHYNCGKILIFIDKILDGFMNTRNNNLLPMDMCI